MHIPQSLQTAVELEQICLVPNHIISPGTSTPCIEISQDTLIGAYLLTLKDNNMRLDQMNNYMMFSKKFNGIMPEPFVINDGIPYWSGKQLYSLILPDINISQLKNVKITHGQITEGFLNTDSLGGSSAGLIKQIYNAYGMEACNDFLNDTQKLVTRWMSDNSFTIGFGDATVNRDERKIIKEIIDKYLEESFELVKRAQHGVFANDLDDSYKRSNMEFEMMKILSNLSEKVKDKVMEIIPKSNNFYQAGDKASGAKGKAFNIQQIIGCVGQQDIWGSRIEEGFTERTLPHFARNDIGPDAKGFCRNSFIEGLSPSEMFFHAMGGRTGTIDTAIKSVTGDTPIIIMERGVMKKINIGDWIDNLLEKNKENVKNLPEKEMELYELDYEASIPTTDLDGNVSWGIIKNITRHDPGKELYEIKTRGGRNVIVTESHSLLIWNGKQFERKSTPDVKLGDFVPVTAKLAEPTMINNMKDFDKMSVNIFNSSENEVKKFLISVFDNNYTIKNGFIEYFSESLEFIENLNVCLSRVGIFGKVIVNDKVYLNIDGYWASKLLKLLNKDNNITYCEEEFIQVNDVVLDAILEINKVDIAKYPKVYDLTIPSTLNFGLANGLHVVDTADSGYLSRKFIKAAEDLVVNYDFAVRNASGHIVQFAYGDDNFDPIKLEKVTRIELIEYDNATLESVYKFDSLDDASYFETFMTPGAVSMMMDDPNYKNILNDEYAELLMMRNDLRYKYFNNVEAIGDINTYVPINLFRVIPSQCTKFNVQPFHFSDITPQYIIQNYNDAMNEIVKYLPEGNSNWKLFRVIFKSFLSTKNVLKKYRMNKAVFDSIILIIKEKMLNALINPGEMVGIIGAQTLGEISTQLTLNSVTYETEVLIRDSNKKIKKYQIGEFIEREIRRSGAVDYDESKNTTYATCADYFEIQACDEDGNVFWDVIEAVTKHPVINRDGSNTMLKITTEDEREAIATKAKSFLKLIDGKIVPIEGENLKVGDYLPISTKEVDYEENFTLDLKELLPPTEYVYGSELEKAKAVMKEHHWWMKHANKTFILPHKRSDTVVQLASDRVRPGRKTKCTILDGFVYMLNSCSNVYTIPEVIDLDYNFGYLIGAYAAEGAMTDHQLSIANNDESYFEPILELCERWNITTKIYKNENKNETGWTSQDLRIYNTLLCRILEKLVGKLSHNKFISDIITFSNKDCLRGFLDAYIGGDGSVNKTSIAMYSTSKVMLKSVQIILRAFGVFSYIHKPPKQKKNNRGSLDIKQMYYLNVYGEQSRKLANILNMKIDYKQDNLELIKKHDHKTKYGKRFEKIPNEIDGELFMEERYDTFSDVIFSKIKSIEEVPNTTDYAYDLTVKKTKTFLNGEFIVNFDTFHSAGVGAGSLVITEGIPRLREIINISKNLKNKNMLIYLNKEYSLNKDNARKVQSKFAYTQLKDILAKTEILFDNKEGFTDTKEDIEFIKSYKEFSELFDNDNIDESCLSPWILRLTFDKESLMNRKITIQEIQETIKENFHNDQEIDCVYSDDSVNDVIMRIRIKQDSKGSFLEFMKDFEKQLIDLPLRGISNINQVEIAESNIIKYNDDGSFSATKEWVLKTSGSNLIDILGDSAVDISRTITNDIVEFHEIFGIEATRELIYRELSKVYAEKHPNPRHIQMMSDIMTYRGKLMQIDRHGLNKNSEIGPIAKASFEEVMNIFTKAALFAEKDNMKGVSANILAGQFCKSGTNAFEILIDEEKMLEKVEVSDYVDSDYIDVNETDINKVFAKTYNDYEPTDNVEDSDFNFGFGIEESKQYVLNDIDTSNVIVINSNDNSIEEEDSKNIDFEKITVDVPSYENVDTNGNNMNIDFEQIDINEPVYEEAVPEEVVPDKKKKTIKVKKVKSEDTSKEGASKKVRISKKKKSDEDEK